MPIVKKTPVGKITRKERERYESHCQQMQHHNQTCRRENLISIKPIEAWVTYYRQHQRIVKGD